MIWKIVLVQSLYLFLHYVIYESWYLASSNSLLQNVLLTMNNHSKFSSKTVFQYTSLMSNPMQWKLFHRPGKSINRKFPPILLYISTANMDAIKSYTCMMLKNLDHFYFRTSVLYTFKNTFNIISQLTKEWLGFSC